jgi:uncharacterized protein (DUF1330 family)
MALYSLNLFDLADNESYRQYSRRSARAVGKHYGRVVALGRLDGVQVGEPDVVPRTVMILVEWPSRQAFCAFLDDPEHADLHQRCARRERATTSGGSTSAWRI